MYKIDELLSEEHILEIGTMIRFKPQSVVYTDIETKIRVKISYHTKFFTHYLINEICNKSTVIKRSCLMLLKIVKDSDLDAHIKGKGWLLMFFSFLIFKNHIPTIISDGSGSSQNLEAKYEALRLFLDKFEEDSKQELESNYEMQEHKLIEEFRDLIVEEIPKDANVNSK